MPCADCSALADRRFLLESRVRELGQLLSVRNAATADGVSPGHASLSTSPVSTAVTVEFVPARQRRGRECRSKSPVVWPGQQSPHQTANQFSALSFLVSDRRLHPTPCQVSVASHCLMDTWGCNCDTGDVTLGRSQVTREPASDTVSAGMESTSPVNMACQGYSAEHQTDSLLLNTETVTFPYHSPTESSSNCVGHENVILISTSDSGEVSQQAPYPVLIKYKSKSPLHPVSPTCTSSQNIPLQKGTLFQFLYDLPCAPLSGLSLETAPLILKPSNLASLILDHCS